MRAALAVVVLAAGLACGSGDRACRDEATLLAGPGRWARCRPDASLALLPAGDGAVLAVCVCDEPPAEALPGRRPL